MSELIRIPTETDYDAAIELTDEYLRDNGSIWAQVMRPEIEGRYKESERTQLESLTLLTMGAEKIVEGPLMEDPVPARRALRYGMQIGIKSVELLYNDTYKTPKIAYALRELISSNVGDFFGQPDDDADNNERKEHFLHERIVIFKALGERGLQEIGLISSMAIERWAEDVTSESHLQGLFMLGFGATVIAARAMHESILKDLEDKKISEINWDKIPRPDTSE